MCDCVWVMCVCSGGDSCVCVCVFRECVWGGRGLWVICVCVFTN